MLEELKRLLRLPFLTDNLRAAATLSSEASWNSSHRLGLFVITRVLHILDEQWDTENLRDQAWMTHAALDEMEARMRPPIIAYLDALDAEGLNEAQELVALNAVVDALFEWTAARRRPRP